jgi:Putative Ig domain
MSSLNYIGMFAAVGRRRNFQLALTVLLSVILAGCGVTLNPPTPLIIATTSLPSGTMGSAYSATMSAKGGVPPYVWNVVSGTLPGGLVLSATGAITGTPEVAWSGPLTVQVKDSAIKPQTATLATTLVISPPPPAPLAITTSSLPAGTVGTPYSATLAASGGVPPYTWSVGASVPLPVGLALSSSGLLSGTPGTVSTSTPIFTVTDSASHTASSGLTLTINPSTGTVPDGYYSFVFAGTAPQGTPPSSNGIAINGTFTVKSGTILNGFYDENSNINPALQDQAITGGSISLGVDGLGQLVLTTASGSMTFALAAPASVATGGKTPIRMIEYDDATGMCSRGSGVIDPALPNPATGAISGNFAFLFSGTDIDQNQQALVGAFQTDGAGNITNGRADANQVVPVGGVPTRETVSFTVLGSYSVDSNGRGSLTVVLDGGSFHFSFYEVSPSEWLVISLDPATLNSPLVSGSVEQQTGGPFSTASLPAISVLEVSGVTLADGAASTPVPDISLGLASSDGKGNVTYTFDEYNGTLTSGNTLSVAYQVDQVTGRTTTTAPAGFATEPILYLIDSTAAFYLGVGPSGQSGIIEAQTGSPFANASLSGDYLGGSLPLVLTSVLNESGLVGADGEGDVTFTTNRSSDTGLLYQSVVGTYAVDSHGRVVVTTPDGLTRILYVVSPAKVAYLTSDAGGYLGSFQQ